MGLAAEQVKAGDPVTAMLLAREGLPSTFAPSRIGRSSPASGLCCTMPWRRSGRSWSCAATRARSLGRVQPGRDADRHRLRATRRRGCGRPTAAASPLVLRGHEGRSPRPRSARTGRGSSPAPRTGRRGCGRPTAAASPWSCAATRRGHLGRRSARTGRGSSPARGTGRRGCGGPTAAASPWSCAATRARSRRPAFSPDGTRIVTGSEDKHGAGVARPTAAASPWSCAATRSAVVSAGVQPGRDARSSPPRGQDGAGVARRRQRRAPGPARPRGARSTSAAFSPDGTRIVTASEDKTARVWRADGSGEPAGPARPRGCGHSAAFSPDGQPDRHRLVTTRRRGCGGPTAAASPWSCAATRTRSLGRRSARTGRGSSPAREDRRRGCGGPTAAASPWSCAATRAGSARPAFSPDGTADRHRPRGQHGAGVAGRRQRRARGPARPQGGVLSAAFSPDGQPDRHRLRGQHGAGVAGRRQRRARGPARPRGRGRLGRRSARTGPGSSPALGDKTARVWRADGSGEPVVLRGHEGAVSRPAFSPDGTRIVTGSGDSTARVWRADGSGEPAGPARPRGAVLSAGFSPDGTRIVTASLDNTARVWLADGSGEPAGPARPRAGGPLGRVQPRRDPDRHRLGTTRRGCGRSSRTCPSLPSSHGSASRLCAA